MSHFDTWKKVENEAGYPCYVDESTGNQQYDHPQFCKIIESIKEYDGIKYGAYRIAFKIFSLQKQLRVPPLRITSGVFARHQLSLSESSLSLDTAELEAVLGDIYFAAQKENLFNGDVDLTVDLMINLLLNIYDENRKEPVRVLAAKILLIILSEESASDKWAALASCCADHNGCVSPRRLATLLMHVTALSKYLGTSCDQLQEDVDACFSQSAGMLGVSARAVSEWAVQHSVSARWLPVLQRVLDSRNSANANANCAACSQPLIQVLKFKCSKCTQIYFCENCYLYDKDLTIIGGHKKTHLVHEIIDGQTKPVEYLSFIKGMKKFLFCTKSKKRKNSKKHSKKSLDKDSHGSVRRRKDGRPNIITSTVGKASGNGVNNPAIVLQDIITQLETQNKALKDLTQIQNIVNSNGRDIQAQVDGHWAQISALINKLKVVKENLTANPESHSSDDTENVERPRAFDLFSPILVVDKKSKVPESKSQPRVLSLDSGNYSVISKQESPNALTMSGDMKPVMVHTTSDSISTVSMNDISNWHTESLAPDKRAHHNSIAKTKSCDVASQSLSATEQKYAADIRSVETSNDKMKELNADLDTVLDRLQQILTNNFATDDSCFDNIQLRETANEVEGLLGSLIRGVEQRATLNDNKGLV